MGFFNDLRKDISQAVNELLPDEEFFGLDDQQEEDLEIKDKEENENEVSEDVGDLLSELADMNEGEEDTSTEEN